MELKEQIRMFVEEEVKNSSYFLTDLTLTSNQRVISIYLDADQGVDIDFCAEVSRAVGAKIDEITPEDFSYTLTVSSSGADKPLKFPRQYPKHIGRNFKLTLINGSVIKGKLVSAHEAEIELSWKEKEKGKKAVDVTQNFAFNEIKEARIILEF